MHTHAHTRTHTHTHDLNTMAISRICNIHATRTMQRPRNHATSMHHPCSIHVTCNIHATCSTHAASMRHANTHNIHPTCNIHATFMQHSCNMPYSIHRSNSDSPLALTSDLSAADCYSRTSSDLTDDAPSPTSDNTDAADAECSQIRPSTDFFSMRHIGGCLSATTDGLSTRM